MQSMHMHLSKYPEPVYSSVRHWDQTSDDVSVSNRRRPKVTLMINSISGSSLDTYNDNVQPSVATSKHPPLNYVGPTDYHIILNRVMKTSLTPHPNSPAQLTSQQTGQKDNKGGVTLSVLQKLNWLFCPGTMADYHRSSTGDTDSHLTVGLPSC